MSAVSDAASSGGEEAEMRARLLALLRTDAREVYRQLVQAALGMEDPGAASNDFNPFCNYFSEENQIGLRDAEVCAELLRMCGTLFGLLPAPGVDGDYTRLADHIHGRFHFEPMFWRDDHFQRMDGQSVVYELLEPARRALGECVQEACQLVYQGLPLYRFTDAGLCELAERDPVVHFMAVAGEHWDLTETRSKLPEWLEGLYFRNSDLGLQEKFFVDMPESPLQIQALRSAYRFAIGVSKEPFAAPTMHPSKLLRLIDVVKMRYYAQNFHPNDEDSWPKQKVIVEWLIGEHGLSKREAEAVDIVTRPDLLRGK